MTQENSTLLFIPDISGFTSFVNRTEIQHSKHIISELLEIIMNCDELGMEVSEIEGDAVLCFKDSIPPVKDLIKQCEQTFTKFHSHLKRYDTERICRCGACETASDLSLKFIIHSGEVEKMSIKGHEKLHGADVILAHRLMKNSISSSEYILFSHSFDLKNQTALLQEGMEITEGKDTYEDIGGLDYSFVSLKGLHKNIPPARSISFPELSSEKISIEEQINAPVELVYDNFTNFEKRLQWNQEIKDIIMHDKQLNQSGALHTCLVGNNELNIEAIGRFEDNDKIVYGERLNKFKVLRDVINIYTFEKKGQETLVQTEIDFKVKSIFSAILKPVIKRKLEKQTQDGLLKLKEVSEAETN